MYWEEPLTYHARNTDPESSHRAAARAFDSGTLAAEILEALEPGHPDWLRTPPGGAIWASCREIISIIWGDGPYTYEEAVKLNKVQTVALKLHRAGYLERRELEGSEIEYRRK